MTKIFITLLIISTIGIISCKKDKDNVNLPPPPSNESEVITTVALTFIDSAQILPTITAIFKDPDGDGGNAATVFDSIKLKSNTTYYASIMVLNETVSPADTISAEISEEATDHLFCYTPNGPQVNIIITDSDGTLPLGLSSKWRTAAISSGTVKIVLKHQPGVKDGSCNKGDTDIELDFGMTVH